MNLFKFLFKQVQCSSEIWVLKGDFQIDGKNKADVWEFFTEKPFIETNKNFLWHIFDIKRSEQHLFLVVNNAYICKYVRRFQRHRRRTWDT